MLINGTFDTISVPYFTGIWQERKPPLILFLPNMPEPQHQMESSTTLGGMQDEPFFSCCCDYFDCISFGIVYFVCSML